jgi:GSCFA family
MTRMLGKRRPIDLEEGGGVDSGQVGTFSPLEPAGGRRSWATSRWHKDNVSLFPKPLALYDDVPQLFREWVLPGHLPPGPILTENQTVVTLGSCFAMELRKVLESARFSSSSFWIPSGLNNTFAILDFVSWCVRGEGTQNAYRYERSTDGSIGEWTPSEERERYLEHIREAGAFVFTLGLSEVWCDRDTGAVFWRGVPEHIFDEERHVFRLSSPAENQENILLTIDLVREQNPTAPIVLTLSPVPLEASFRDISCMTADCVSKSVLRVAIDGVMGERRSHVYYWPSFELVKWVGSVLDWRAYEGDARHADRYLVFCIVDAFVEAFYGPEAAAELRSRLKGTDFAAKQPHPLRVRATKAARKPGLWRARAGRAPERLKRELARLK